MGGGDEAPVPNKDLASSFTEDEAKDLKGSMLGWVDATESNGVIFSKKEVYVHPSASPKSHLAGFLSIVRHEAQVSIHWTPNSMIVGAPKPIVTQQPTRDDAIMRRESSSSKLGASRTKLIEGPLEVSQKYSMKIPISEIYSMKKYIPSIGYSYLIVNTKGGVSHPPFYFHDGGLKEFLAVFDGFVTLTKSPEDPNAFLVNDHSDKLVRTLSKFNVNPPPSSFSPQEETSPGPWDPTSAIFGNFAKVTQVARALFDPRPQGAPRTVTEERRKLLADYENFRKLRAKKTNQNILDHSQQTTTNLGEFEVLSSDSTRPIEEAVRKEPLSPFRWKNYFDSEGRIVDVESLKEEIFVGGLDPSLRIVAWKFLLGYYPMDSTAAERELIQLERREEYLSIKRQWTSITPRQAQYFSKFKKRYHQIEKDVERTDREHEFFKDDDSPNLVKLHDILLTYTFFNFDLGYVQGMNDLLSPVLMLMEDEADAFWCFVGYMESMRHNFDKDQHGMHKLLLNLRKILQLLDPQFYHYLEKVDSLNMFFCFRWLLINFKREFPLQKVMSLWEVIWACPLTPQFHLFVALAILQQHKEYIMNEGMQFDDLLKYCNELSMKLDLDYCLKEAEILFYKFQKLAVTPEQKQLVQ